MSNMLHSKYIVYTIIYIDHIFLSLEVTFWMGLKWKMWLKMLTTPKVWPIHL